MELTGLGYVGVRAKTLDDWAGYGTRLLGMQIVDRSAKTLALRMDDRRQRVLVSEDGGKGIGFYGWETANAVSLEALAARLERNRVTFKRGDAALAGERRVKDLIVLNDPAGNRVEIFHGPEIATDSFRPGRAISGFRTGPLGMGHAVLTVERADEVIPFYQDNFGFRLSDYVTKPFRVYFFHTNARHHSLAILENGRNGVHHLMVELYSLDDVGQGYDLAQLEEGRIGVTLGRHTNDHMTSFYAHTPSEFMFEYGWGGRSIEVDTWQAQEVTDGPSLWGHERLWLPPEQRVEAREMRLRAAANGLREPVNVIAGNHRLAPGACPWFDGVRERLDAAE
jgi:2,3-dihydroxybiphenyl 1,2-dioxygenase